MCVRVCASLPAYVCVTVRFHVNVWQDSSVQGVCERESSK